MPRRLIAAVAAVATSALVFVPVTAADAKAAPKFATCKALNKKYPHGVGKKGARDKVSGKSKPVTTFKVSTKIYNANKGRDRDKDGVACEKR